MIQSPIRSILNAGAARFASAVVAFSQSLRGLLRRRQSFEAVATLAVLVILAPYFIALGGSGDRLPGRYAAADGPVIERLPNPQLSFVCRDYGGWLASDTYQEVCVKPLPRRLAPLLNTICSHVGETLRNWLCGVAGGKAEVGNAMTLIGGWIEKIRSAFHEPQKELLASRKIVGAERSDGLEDANDVSATRGAFDEQLRPFQEAYQLPVNGIALPRSVDCLWMASKIVWPRLSANRERARFALWLTAVLDGEAESANKLDNGNQLAKVDGAMPKTCAELGSAASIARSATRIMAKARASADDSRKSARIRHVFESAGLQFAAWALIGLLAVRLGRRSETISVVAATGLILTLWALAGGYGDAHLATVERILPELSIRVGAAWIAVSASVWLFAGLGILLFALGRVPVLARMSAGLPNNGQMTASPFAYPGFVFFTGLGWILLLDLSAGAHPKNRYLGLYHQGELWMAFVLLSVFVLWRPLIAKAITTALARIGRYFQNRSAPVAWSIAIALCICVVAIFALIENLRQFTSELGRIWLILGLAWFFYLRANRVDVGTVGYFAPLGLIVLVLAAAMAVTKDMGPLLVSFYAAGVFVVAATATFLRRRRLGPLAVRAWTAGLLLAWIYGLTAALFALGGFHETVAGRIESANDPLLSINDQLALVTWFRESIPSGGYGIGNAPWCGPLLDGSCNGLPLQVHSDYTFTVLAGVAGVTPAILVILGMMFWFFALVGRHSRLTAGLPLNHKGMPDRQAFLSWAITVWVALGLCQLMVTIAGNVGLLPLTGIPLPFMSRGMTSLWVNTILLSLCLNIDRPEGTAHDAA